MIRVLCLQLCVGPPLIWGPKKSRYVSHQVLVIYLSEPHISNYFFSFFKEWFNLSGTPPIKWRTLNYLVIEALVFESISHTKFSLKMPEFQTNDFFRAGK